MVSSHYSYLSQRPVLTAGHSIAPLLMSSMISCGCLPSMLQPTDWAVPRISLIVPAVGRHSLSVLHHWKNLEEQRELNSLQPLPPFGAHGLHPWGSQGGEQGASATASVHTARERSRVHCICHCVPFAVPYYLQQKAGGWLTQPARGRPRGARCPSSPASAAPQSTTAPEPTRRSEQNLARTLRASRGKTQHKPSTYPRALEPGICAASAAQCSRSHQR